MKILTVLLVILRNVWLKWIPQDSTDDKPTLVQVRAWCRQAKPITWTFVDQILHGHLASLGAIESIPLFASDPHNNRFSITFAL